jgi:cytidylate kinase
MTSPIRAHMVIAIDGPAASGKSSTAQQVAEKLGYLHVDSGSLYRALTAAMLRAETTGEAWTSDRLLAHGNRISLRPGTSAFSVLIDGVLADAEIRGSAVTAHVSLVAQMSEVRVWVNDRVRSAAETQDVVVDGRDMGTAVFPDAPLKIFLIADPWERASRRLMQRLHRLPTDDEVAEEVDALVHRDAKDATQTVQAKDAILLDTTYLTQPDQVERIVALAHAVSHRPNVT